MHHPLMAASPDSPPRVLLTGVTGYVGSRLLPRLVAAGYPMRAVTRRPVTDGNLAVEYVVADVLNELSLTQAMTGCKAAFYLIHSLGVGGDFEEEERRCAASFGRAARAAGIERIIYLGGLGDSGDALSPHLRSRQRVGAILAESGVPVIEFRASVIIGSGSLSFEMIRALVERLPVMITPRWVSVIAQPIAIDDVLQYLVAGVSCPVGSTHRIYEIGGAEQISYGGLMRTYAELRGLRRLFLPVPVLTPNLSSLWLRLVTPLLASVGRKLIE
ncbi:MAG TPA: NAD(P)H-binding protein, partial [candidate division Zixibacteria bacterium]|nr:NAD(P)H-binding protein [candidate division Zixibacteria bacterium]